MRQLMDVIVRKRPLAGEAGPAETTAPDAGSGDEGGPVAPPRPPAPAIDTGAAAALAGAGRPQIWDLDAPGDDPVPDPLAEQVRRRRALSGLPGVAPAEFPAAAGGGRAKTRVLGFHGGEIAPDVFGAPRVAPGAVARFPAGWIVVVEGPGRGASFTLGAGVSTIGRGADQTVALDFGDTSISREMHASIAYDEEQNRFFIGHGGKSNIVRRNGAPVLATEDLADGDIIRIGRTALRFVALCGPGFTWATEGGDADAD